MPKGNTITVDLTNYKDRVGGRVDPGEYQLTVEDAETDESRNGHPMIILYLRVTGGEHDGATIVDRLTLTEKAMFRVVNFLQAIGAPTPKKRFSLDVTKLRGKKVLAELDDGEPYNGRVKSEVRGYMKLTAAARADEESDGDDGLDDSGDDGDTEGDGADEFAEETTSNPSSKSNDNEGDDKPTSGSAPEEVDLDSIEL